MKERDERMARRTGIGALVLGLVGLACATAFGQGAAGSGAARTTPAGGRAPATSPAGKSAGGTAEEVAAVVGDTPILRSEVEEQVQAAAEQMQVAASDTAAFRKLHQDVLNRMIDDQILLLEAKAQNLKAEDDEISKAVDGAIQNAIRSAGGPDAFQSQLQKQGLTEQELRTRYREEARKEIVTTKLVQKEIRPKVTVSDSTVRRFYEENRSQLPKKPRALRIQDLFIRTHPDSVVERRTRDRALEVRKKILAGLSFADAAAKNSDDPRGKEGGSLGRVGRGDLDPDLDQAAWSLAVGEVSQPVRSRFGYHLLEVTAKDPDGQWIEVSHILFGITPSRADEMETRDKAQKIRDDIAGGRIDFADAIRKFSDDSNSKARDGDMGWIPIDNFYGDMKAAVDTIRVGHIAGPVSGDGGYHIFKVVGDQAEGNYTFDEIQDQMKQLAAQQAMQKELRAYLDKLRQKYFVEIRAGW